MWLDVDYQMEIIKTYPLVSLINGWIIDNIFKLKKFLRIGLILLEESKDSNLSSEDSEIQKEQLPIFNVRNEPVMIEAINVITLLGKSNKAILRAKGNSIPNAVAIANIITEKMLKGNSKIQNIILDTDMPAGIGKMLSTIEIVLLKN